jgi:menaquinone-dependent protoporphyrinogen IX oxidase
LVNLLSVRREILGTRVQHIQQRHLGVGIHPVNMNNVTIALKLDNIIVVSSITRQTAHAQQTHQYAPANVILVFHPFPFIFYMVYYHTAKINNNLKDTKLFCKRVITHVNFKNACNYLLSHPRF